MKKLLFLVFLLNQILYGENFDKLKKIFYLDDSNTSKVISNEYFLSDRKEDIISEEVKELKNILNTDKRYLVACNYPYRYSLLREIDKNTPIVDLKKCNELQGFLDSFQKKNIALVFTSEYTNNPSSAFGHIMLLFYDDKKNMAIGDTVHFAAKTNKSDGFFKYIKNGLVGEYEGYFLREPFFKKIYEYNILEQRYMFIYTLDFSKKEINDILLYLYELRKASFKYYFLDENCASRTTDLLNIVIDKNKEEKNFYLPIDTVKEFQKYIKDEDRFIPTVNSLNILFSEMNNKQKNIFNNIINKNAKPDSKLDNIIKEALVNYYSFMFRRFHISFKNYDSVMALEYDKNTILDLTPSPIDDIQPSSLGTGYISSNIKDNRFYIEYRPQLIDKYDIQSNSLQDSEVINFSFALSTDFDSNYLEFIDLVSINSYHKVLDFYSPLSWNLYSGINRNTPTNNLKYDNFFGLGQTYEMFYNFYFNYIFNVGIDYRDFENEFNGYLKPKIYLYTTIKDYIKIGIEASYSKYLNNDEKFYEVFYTQKLVKEIYMKFKYKNIDNKNKKSLFSINYNF